MLPPQLHAHQRSLASAVRPGARSVLSSQRSAMALCQARGFWGWKRHEWSSHLDPLYHRSMRYRTLKTRAKLLDKLKRKSKFEWDMARRPFMAPNYIRWASHVNRHPSWHQRTSAVETDADNIRHDDALPDDLHELSQREKRWKEHMDAVRKRIEQDPYQAVFGKRFEPFWSPLVPSWMKQQLGNHRAAPVQEEAAQAESQKTSSVVKPIRDAATESDRGPASGKSYSYASSTSWDSWTNKTRRSEWDSTTRKTRSFEYDPVSNRMVQVGESSTQPKGSDVSEALNPPSTIRNPPPSALLSLSKPTPPKSRDITPSSAKPAALANMPKNDLDLLTADDVRAKMGKIKPVSAVKTTPAERQTMQDTFDQSSEMFDREMNTLLKERSSSPATATEQTSSVFDGAMDTLTKERARSLEPSINRLGPKQTERFVDPDDSAAHESTESAVGAHNIPRGWSKQADVLQSARVQRTSAKVPSTVPELDAKADTWKLESAGRKAIQVPTSTYETRLSQQMDTLTIEKAQNRTSTLEEQKFATNVNTLEVDKARSSSNGSSEEVRLSAKMDTLKSELAKMKEREASYEAELAVRTNTLQLEKDHYKKANTLLQDEISEQKSRLHSYETRYAHKIQTLRQELEVAYKQSSKHADAHVDRIRTLEAELAKAQKATGESITNVQVPAKTMQGEGDVCSNVSNFTNSSKWYKQAAPAVSPYEKERAAQRARDQALVKQVREIYENEYGRIDSKHTQPAIRSATGEKAALREQLHKTHRTFTPADEEKCMEMRKAGASWSDVAKTLPKRNRHGSEGQAVPMAVDSTNTARDNALAEYDETQAYDYTFKADNLESELAQKFDVASASREDIPTTIMPRAAKVNAAATQTQEDVPKPAENAVPSEVAIQWEEPPVYKVLAYDSGNDLFSTATTTSNFTPSERPISIPEALAQLYQPARFVSHFADLQKEGFQAIYGTRDILVFKKIKSVTPGSDKKSAPTDADHIGLVDHGLIKPMENALAEEAAMYYDKYKPAPKEYDPTSIENGTLMPKENSLAREAANYYDNYRTAVNPVDGTTRSNAYPRPTTGNFASPTGFVNYDPIFPEEKETPRPREEQGVDDIEYVHYPKVRRQEPVFSGSSHSRVQGIRQQRKEERRQAREERDKSRRRGAGAVKWALSVGLTSAAMCYLIGLSAEMARQEKRDNKERWQRVVDGKQN